MGLLVEGRWVDKWYDTKRSNGRFIRSDSQFRSEVTRDGSSGFPAEAGRYHLYVSLACPWAHRVLIYRKLKGLEAAISVTAVAPHMWENGWVFGGYEGADEDPLFHAQYMHQIYTKAQSDYSGRVTVPVLWDKQTNTIVSNESSEIIRFLNTEFDEIGVPGLDFYPEELREEIDEINERVYHNVNNGVYKCGFATTQEAYEEAFDALFGTLDWLEQRLETRRWLCGERVTEADWRLLPTLLRFDPVYFGHFKCNHRRIADYPELSDYTRALYQTPGIADTFNLDHVKTHYYGSHKTVNPSLIVPKGPALEWNKPTRRPSALAP
jgi:putative glutathione S-transferase